MSQTDARQPHHAREQKRAQFAEPARKKNKSVSILAIVFIALAGVAAYLVITSMNDKPSPAAVVAKPGSSPNGLTTADNREIRIRISDVSAGMAKFYDYKTSDNIALRFFAVKSRDGDHRVAMDACEVCFHAKKGYHQEGEDMVCNNCGRRFAIARIGEFQGGCHPISVPRAIEGDTLVVKASELESRGRYFQ